MVKPDVDMGRKFDPFPERRSWKSISFVHFPNIVDFDDVIEIRLQLLQLSFAHLCEGLSFGVLVVVLTH